MTVTHLLKHVRKQRERIGDALYTLSSLVPGLKKRDEESVLSKTVEYLKQLQEKVKSLEEQVAIEAEPTNKQAKDVPITAEQSPKIEMNVFDNMFLIKINRFQGGMLTLVTALDLIESLHMRVVTANSVQFSDQIHITIACQVEEGYDVTINDLFKSLMSALENSV